MDLLGWAFYLLAAATALLVVGYLYRRRETPGRGRTLLAALRWAALSVLILLLFDPELPAPGFAAGGSSTRVLVDASLSMRLPVDPEGETTRWQQAAGAAERLAGGGDVLLFGESTARTAPADSLSSLEPTASASRLVPALQAASEAGDRRVVVLTDGGIDDAAEVERILPDLGLEVEVRSVAGDAVANRGLVEVEAPAWAEAGEPLEVRIGVGAVGPAADSVTVVLRQDDRVRARARIPTPAPGRIASATLRFTPQPPANAGGGDEPEGGLVRYDLAFETEDAAPADDRRSVYVYVSKRPAGIALVSFQPTWEPRFLQPVLARSLGLPVRGYLLTEDDHYVTLGTGLDAGRVAGAVEVREVVGEADLVVLHGLSPAAPEWALDAAREARRVLIFPAGDVSSLELPVELGRPIPGDWYLAAELPSSPVTPLLASVTIDQLPPLSGLHPTAVAGDAWAPLSASLGRTGTNAPVLLAGERDQRRWAVALADGYWRWAFHGGEPRQVYRRLWAALGGWLVQDEPAVAAAAVRPEKRVVPRGQAVRWLAPGLAADSISVQVADEAGQVALDTIVPVLRGEAATTPALAPGHYRYSARAFVGGEAAASAQGPLSVESFSPEFTRAAVPVAGLGASGSARAGSTGDRTIIPGEPLHSSPWPYLLFVLLVSTEWVLRRRWGLR